MHKYAQSDDGSSSSSLLFHVREELIDRTGCLPRMIFLLLIVTPILEGDAHLFLSSEDNCKFRRVNQEKNELKLKLLNKTKPNFFSPRRQTDRHLLLLLISPSSCFKWVQKCRNWCNYVCSFGGSGSCSLIFLLSASTLVPNTSQNISSQWVDCIFWYCGGSGEPVNFCGLDIRTLRNNLMLLNLRFILYVQVRFVIG